MSIDGGTRIIRKHDNVQLKQKIIHLQAELSRYKQLVAKYQNNYHYNQLDELNSSIENLRQILKQKEEEISLLKEAKIDIEEHVKVLVEEKSQFGDNHSELIEQINVLKEENSLLKEENELVKLENISLQKTLDHQEEEVTKLRESVKTTEKEKSIFKPKKATEQLKKENDPSESWFLRTLKQQNKEDE